MRRELSKGKSTSVGFTLFNIGVVYEYMARYEKALEYYMPALQIYQACLDSNDPDVASTQHCVGAAYYGMG